MLTCKKYFSKCNVSATSSSLHLLSNAYMLFCMFFFLIILAFFYRWFLKITSKCSFTPRCGDCPRFRWPCIIKMDLVLTENDHSPNLSNIIHIQYISLIFFNLFIFRVNIFPLPKWCPNVALQSYDKMDQTNAENVAPLSTNAVASLCTLSAQLPLESAMHVGSNARLPQERHLLCKAWSV